MSHDTAPNLPPLEGRGYEQIFLGLVALFIAALVACNLIFQKFFSWTIWLPFVGDYEFQQSVGIIPYPLTFLVTDILSECYGRRRANLVVVSGLAASAFMVLLVLVADGVTATTWSQVDDSTFTRVFGLSWIAVGASMTAYLVAQFLDIRFFHFWRRLTKGRHLWLRNNASTIGSQVVDTGTVLGLLCVFDVIAMDNFWRLFLNGVLFKIAWAALDTPLFYLAVAWFRRRFPQQMLAAHPEDTAPIPRAAALEGPRT